MDAGEGKHRSIGAVLEDGIAGHARGDADQKVRLRLIVPAGVDQTQAHLQIAMPSLRCEFGTLFAAPRQLAGIAEQTHARFRGDRLQRERLCVSVEIESSDANGGILRQRRLFGARQADRGDAVAEPNHALQSDDGEVMLEERGLVRGAGRPEGARVVDAVDSEILRIRVELREGRMTLAEHRDEFRQIVGTTLSEVPEALHGRDDGAGIDDGRRAPMVILVGGACVVDRHVPRVGASVGRHLFPAYPFAFFQFGIPVAVGAALHQLLAVPLVSRLTLRSHDRSHAGGSLALDLRTGGVQAFEAVRVD